MLKFLQTFAKNVREEEVARKKSAQETTIIDVAKEAGVSYSTVSRVLNDKSYVKPETREKVLEAMDRLGYQVNLQARSLAGGTSKVIGLLVVDLATQYMGQVIHGIDDVLAANQYELMLYTTHRQKSKESIYVNMMARGLADGLLIVLPRDPEAYLAKLRERDFPFVLIDQLSQNQSDLSVTAANRLGGYEATKHLIDLGHKRIAIVTGWMDMISSRDRLEGYKSALANYNIPLDDNLIFEGDFNQTKGYEGAQYLLDLPSPPTAIFASNDVAAIGVMNGATSRGLSVPDDLSVIGFDDVPIAKVLTPKLTTIRQPLQEMGSVATQLLLDLIDKTKNTPESVILPIELIIRESTAPPKQQ